MSQIDSINHKNSSGEYGILIGDKYSLGREYAKEASNRVLRYCFEELKLIYINLVLLKII